MNINSDNNRIRGYKGFYKGLVNNWGEKFEVGKKYIIDDKYVNYGFHFCERFEDIFLFFKDVNELEFCEVVGSGKIGEYYNDYSGVYNVYYSSELEIIRKLSRKDIIDMFLNLSFILSNRVVRFISCFKLTDEEIKLFKDKFYNDRGINLAIRYYQEGDKMAYYNDVYRKELKYKK